MSYIRGTFLHGLAQCRFQEAFRPEYPWMDGTSTLKAEEKDSICIFLGGRVPFVIRPKADGQYQFIGECYVHGLMDGEAMNDLEVGKYRVEEITLC